MCSPTIEQPPRHFNAYLVPASSSARTFEGERGWKQYSPMQNTVTDGLCTQCVKGGSVTNSRARVAELEARIAELQPMAECRPSWPVCGYFGGMRGPDFGYIPA